jgi:hypothetical protein
VEEENENPFLVNDPETVWEEWKKQGKPVSRKELEKKVREADRLQKSRGEQK